MDRNNLIGFVLIALVIIVFSWWSAPSAEEQRAAFVQDSIAQVEQLKAEKQKQIVKAKAVEAKKKALEDTTALFHNALNGTGEKVVLKNEKVELTFNTKGATVEQAVVKGFPDRKGNPDVTLFDARSTIYLAKTTCFT